MYDHKHYPRIKHTRGTAFVTELSELMDLEVGHHAYIAELMDRYWTAATTETE
eukprot:CAMPEP_0172508364 /NCGR_PEP_ID=MMETSP1066-20121228/211352_1 /TAXON_ID=671091 /ORGANISM="Coscinodiscus wailesii, Strain CCMP2513" /LENGTH=52 /DNA_ID=CAMNT_0013286309 /DNA_START=44 /DNA_END=202 /DNA_ORIENTATION=-